VETTPATSTRGKTKRCPTCGRAGGLLTPRWAVVVEEADGHEVAVSLVGPFATSEAAEDAADRWRELADATGFAVVCLDGPLTDPEVWERGVS
jgi:poly(3-hydroxybutyrate) depolymerase